MNTTTHSRIGGFWSTLRLSSAALLLSMISLSAKADEICAWVDWGGYYDWYCYDVEVPTPAAGAHNVFRFYSGTRGDHLFTTAINEVYGGQNGFYYEDTAFAAYNSAIDSNTQLLYRCWITYQGNHFISTDSNCEGQTADGSLGYVSTIPRTGHSALYRFWNGGYDHFITTNFAEGYNAGYSYESTLGYVPNY